MRRSLLFGAVLALAACAQPDLAGQRYAVYFEEGQATLDTDAKENVATAASWAVAHPTATVRVIGYADPEGSSADNLTLSLARAHVVVVELTALGVPRDHIKLAGHGEIPYSLDPQEARRVLVALSKP